MRFLSLFFILFGLNAWAQQEFFSAQNKTDAISYYKDRLYRGCSDLKEEQEAISPKDLKNMVALTSQLVEDQYSQAFLENPKVKDSFKRDLLEISKDQNCQKVGNDCRARLLGLSIYYYQTFRADLPGCHAYKSVPPMEKGFDQNCEVELKYRKSTLQGVQSANYGMPSAGTYRKWLVKLKNDTTMDLFNIILRKDRQNLHICNSVQSGIVHQYALELDEPGSYFVGLDPDYVPEKNLIKECIDEKVTLYSEFVPTSFDEGRSTVGADQIEPVKVKIMNFVKSNPELIVTDISVTASSSKTPFNTVIGGKKVIDPKSDERNLSLASERALFAGKVLNQIKSSTIQLSGISFETKAELSGPDFDQAELNTRFVTKMTPGYLERVEAMYKSHEKIFKEQALKNSPMDLLDEKEFVNLYQAKYKPFQGFRIHIRGHKKEEMKCLELTTGEKKSKDKTSKQ